MNQHRYGCGVGGGFLCGSLNLQTSDKGKTTKLSVRGDAAFLTITQDCSLHCFPPFTVFLYTVARIHRSYAQLTWNFGGAQLDGPWLIQVYATVHSSGIFILQYTIDVTLLSTNTLVYLFLPLHGSLCLPLSSLLLQVDKQCESRLVCYVHWDHGRGIS